MNGILVLNFEFAIKIGITMVIDVFCYRTKLLFISNIFFSICRDIWHFNAYYFDWVFLNVGDVVCSRTKFVLI